MWTGLRIEYGSVSPKTARMRTASSSAGSPWSMTVRWPTGFMNPASSPRRLNPSNSPSAAVVLPRFWPVAARYSWRIDRPSAVSRRLGARGRLALDQRDAVAHARDRVGVDRLGLEVRPEPIHDVRHQAEEDGGVGDEELRLVVVADQGQAALQDAPLLDMRDLGREVVALDPVRVVEEVERVVDRQPEAGAPGHEALVHLRRDAH